MMIVDILLVIISILVIICVGLQQPKQGLSDSLSGENSELFKQQKERGFEAILIRVTCVLCIGFILLGIGVYMH